MCVAFHRKGKLVKTTKVSNKSTFLANASVIWFPQDKRDFPFPMFVRRVLIGILIN